MVQAYIGVGSNLDDPVSQVQSAIQTLQDLQGRGEVISSSLYRSRPLGPQDQPDFINAVVLLETDLDPDELLDALQKIEQGQGRQRGAERWGPRTLDLDILLYAGQIIASDRLIVPHPGLHERSFVLYPLQEIAADLTVPGRGTVSELIEALPDTHVDSIVKL